MTSRRLLVNRKPGTSSISAPIVAISALRPKPIAENAFARKLRIKLHTKDLKKSLAFSLPMNFKAAPVAAQHRPAASASITVPPKNMPNPKPMRNAPI